MPNQIFGAIYRKDRALLEQLAPSAVNVRDADGRTPLMHAILADNPDSGIVQLLIQNGADVDAVDGGQHWTALHFAARDQHTEVVKLLLDAHATVDPVDVFGNTPLWRSVMNSTSDLSAITTLILAGADPGHKNNAGKAPIDVARDTGRDDIVALFNGAKRRVSPKAS